MKDLFRQYAYHIDGLREEAGIKINDFCEDVCDPRTYRYYTSGQRVMSQNVLNDFCKKLGFTPAEFFTSYNIRDKEEYQNIIDLYFDISGNLLESARKRLIILDQKNFTNLLAESLYKYCVISYNHKSKQITKDSAYEMYKALIDYPRCLEKNTFSFTETSTIHAICLIERQSGIQTAFTFLSRFLTDSSIQLVSSNHKDILPTTYATVSQTYGILEDHKNACRIAELGIKYCIRNQTLLNLDTLYYYACFFYFKMDNPLYKELSFKYLSLTHLKRNSKYLKEVITMLEKDGITDHLDYFRQFIK